MLGYEGGEMIGRDGWEFDVESEAARAASRACCAARPARRRWSARCGGVTGRCVPVLVDSRLVRDERGGGHRAPRHGAGHQRAQADRGGARARAAAAARRHRRCARVDGDVRLRHALSGAAGKSVNDIELARRVARRAAALEVVPDIPEKFEEAHRRCLAGEIVYLP